MRTKALLGLAALVAGTFAASAQVYSLNIVGYVNKTCDPGFTMIGNPLTAGGNKVSEIFPASLPGFSLLTWNGASFDENINYGSGAWDDDQAVLAPGTGAFVKNTGTTPITFTFVGEVMSGNPTLTLIPGLNMVSSKVPVEGNLQTSSVLNLTNGVANSSILTWNGTSYDENIYYGAGAWDTDPMLGVAQGFFYKNAGAANVIWTEVFP